MNNYLNFEFTDKRYMILRTIETYTRTTSGKSWKKVPDLVECEVVSAEYYTNYITSVPFFNNFGDGASCRAKYTYEIAGYLPTRITSISPFREKKVFAKFEFISLGRMESNAGYREKEIVKNAKSFKREYVNGRDMLYLYTDDSGDTAEGIYDITANRWRG